MPPLQIAAAQYPVTGDLSRNFKYIRKQICAAANQGAHILLFPETALCGYGPKHFQHNPGFIGYDWTLLHSATVAIQELAVANHIWVVLGTMRQSPGAALPTNSLLVINPDGAITAQYNKQRLYKHETEFYTPGSGGCTLTINGYHCGFLICYDNCFPELYDEYRNAGVQLLFHAFYNAANSKATSIKDLMHANLLVRAADNQFSIAAANSSEAYSPLVACVAHPDGSSIRARRNRTDMVQARFPSNTMGWTYNNRDGC